MELILYAILPLLVVIGALSGIAAFMKLGAVQQRLGELESRLDSILREQPGKTTDAAAEPTPVVGDSQAKPVVQARVAAQVAPEDVKPPLRPKAARRTVVTEESRAVEKAGIDWRALLQQYWMVILGGVCLVLAGIFLVRYSIEHGILGPEARIVLGLLFGVVLTISGEWLRRTGRLVAGVHAALVASGVLVIYSALLVGLHVYSLYSAEAAFISMAIVSALSMMLAIKHGPLMAGMGMLGAYLVPILVSTGSKNIEAALLYSLFVTAGSLWLQRFVYRPWLWWGTWLGALGWFLISLDMPDQAQGIRGLYLAALAYACVALPFSGLRLASIDLSAVPVRQISAQINAVYAALTVAVILLLHVERLNELSYPSLAVLPVIAMMCSRHNMPMLRLLPWLTLSPFVIELISTDVNFVGWQVSVSAMAVDMQKPYITMLLLISAAAVFVGGSEVIKGRAAGYWSTFALFVPLAALLLAYIRITGFGGGLEWGVPTIAIAILYGFLLDRWRKRKGETSVEAALTIASQTAVALALFMVFSQVTLTLVLALQLVGLALIDRKMRLPALPHVMKALLLIIIVRLTFNPWILIYEVKAEILLLTYFGCLGACYAAGRIIRDRILLKVWIDSASAHLLVLTLAVFTRFIIYDGDIFARSFNLTEASVYINSWAAIGLVYDWKANKLHHYQAWYRSIAMLHIIAAAFIYLFYNLLVHNPLWSTEVIGSTPIINLLLLAYGLPVVWAALVYLRFKNLKQAAGLIGLVGLFAFFTIQVRHLWHGGIDPDMPVLDGELYTYSLVWLLLAVATMVLGAYRKNAHAQKAGMAVLVLVILKAFLWDMADLDGLWRVVSFLGLGLALLGIAYLFNQMKNVGSRRM